MNKPALICCFSLMMFFSALMAQAGTVMVFGASGGNIAVNVNSRKEARFKTTLKQKYDFSCGSATLASLLTFHYNDPVSEEEVFKAMYEAGDKEKIRKDGFSLLDIKNYLSDRGYQSDGFRIPLDKLMKLGVPAIVLINDKGYSHFVIIKGVSATEIILGDPAHGLRRMDRTKFESMWGGLLFLIKNRIEIAREHFNQENEWRINPKAPVHLALEQREIADILLMLPGKNDF